MLLPPLNDKECLTLLHEEIKRSLDLPTVRAFASRFRDLGELIEYIRNLEQRDDLGDPNDGPRFTRKISELFRSFPEKPHCCERTSDFHKVAEVIDPDTRRTTASIIVDNGWHTFPVEYRDGRPQVVVLDPITLPRN